MMKKPVTADLRFLLLISSFFKKIKFTVERDKHMDLLFHLLMHSLVDSCVCPDR